MADDFDRAWTGVERLEPMRLADLFAAEPDRLDRLVIEESGIRFDFAKTHLSAGNLPSFLALAEAANFTARRDALYAGGLVNATEDRAAEHAAERGEGAPESVACARALHHRMRT
ncbi:MAG: glucose-6-phosphate isomerase, partial [Sphingomonas sp.]